MEDKPLFLRIWDNIRKAFVFSPWPMNPNGRPYMAFMANVLFQENPNPQIYEAIPDGATGATTAETEGLQGVTNQGNRTADWIETGGIAMDSSPAPVAPTGLASVSEISVPNYNQGNVIKQLLGKMTWAEIAVELIPYLNATTPSDGPTVANAIPNQTVNVAGDVTFAFNENTFTGLNLNYTVTKTDGSASPFAFNSSSRSFVWGASVPNGTYSLKVTAQDNLGRSIDTTFTVTIARAVELPNIQSIIRKYDPSSKTVYYQLKSSYQGNDIEKWPVYRCKNASESNWRSDWAATLEASLFQEYASGYKVYAYANLTVSGQATTNTIFQFKPYPDAPDSAILEFPYTLPNAQDYGTEVYHYEPSNAKVTEFYAGAIAGPEKYLSCYAAGSGILKTNLVATGDTPVYANGLKVMTTSDGPYPNANLFSGTKPYGSLYGNAVNGSYNLSIIDDAGNTLTYPIVKTDSGPQVTLKAATSGGGSGDTGSAIPINTSVDTFNKSLFIPSIQWSGGKARVVHTNKPGSGIYLISGQNEITDLPTTYDYYPGDEIEITYIQGATSSSDFSSWGLNKAQVIIQFGQAPA
ncbi:hypothetical protein [Spirosoma litoris]